MTVLVGTTSGVEGAGGLTGRAVGPMATIGASTWALVDGREVWRHDGTWRRAATWDGPPLTCVLPVSETGQTGTGAGGEAVVVGTAEAHVLHLQGDALVLDHTFDELAERATWYTPWGGPPDTRSLAAARDSLLVNVHVGGVARRDGDGRWRPLVDIDVDVHQIVAAGDGSLLAATGAAGFGRSVDGGSTWRWDADGLHGSYCRALAIAGDQVLLSAATGPGRTRGGVYRRRLGAKGAWQRTSDLVEGNIDTFWLAAAGDEAAFVTADGQLWRSDDAGATWERASSTHAGPRGVTVLAA
jgi:hypothetical protein